MRSRHECKRRFNSHLLTLLRHSTPEQFIARFSTSPPSRQRNGMPFEEIQQITFSCTGSSFSETSRDLDEQIPYSQCMSIRSEAKISPCDGEEFQGKSALSIGFQRPTRQSGATLLELQLSCSSIIGRKHRFAGSLKLYVQMADVGNGRTKCLSLPRAAEECLEAISREWLPPVCVIKLLITRGHQEQSGV